MSCEKYLYDVMVYAGGVRRNPLVTANTAEAVPNLTIDLTQVGIGRVEDDFLEEIEPQFRRYETLPFSCFTGD